MTTHAPSRRRRRAPARHRPSWHVALSARLHAPQLDRELAAGIATWRTPRHAARALQLTDPRRRLTLAATLDRLVVEAHHPRLVAQRLSAAIPPSRSSVLACESLIRDIAATLREPVPVTAEGVARLRAILCDGTGPLYTPNRTGELRRALHQITRLMTVSS
jgi:hypothetical protein